MDNLGISIVDMLKSFEGLPHFQITMECFHGVLHNIGGRRSEVGGQDYPHLHINYYDYLLKIKK